MCFCLVYDFLCFLSTTSIQKYPHIGYYYLQNNKNQITDLINQETRYASCASLAVMGRLQKGGARNRGPSHENCPPRAQARSGLQLGSHLDCAHVRTGLMWLLRILGEA